MEIERKYLVKQPPDLSAVVCREMERYYLSSNEDEEIRIQRVDQSYSYERKVKTSKNGRTKELHAITKTVFDELKQSASRAIVRSSYDLGHNLSIKIYHDTYEGLMRAEKEFANEKEANACQPEPWMGPEITESPLGRDSRLLTLNQTQFKEHLDGLRTS